MQEANGQVQSVAVYSINSSEEKHVVNPCLNCSPGRLLQEDSRFYEFEASLGYIVRLCPNKQINTFFLNRGLET